MAMVRVEIIMNDVKLEKLKRALVVYKVSGMTVYKARGCGVQYGTPEYMEEDTSELKLLEKTVVVLYMPENQVNKMVHHLEQDLYTGHIGDGKIFVSDINNAYRIRTGEEGYDALQPAAF